MDEENKKEEEIRLLTESDVLRALHNLYLEKRVGAQMSYRFFEQRLKKPRNGDSVEKIKEQKQAAINNIADNQIMLDILDDFLK